MISQRVLRLQEKLARLKELDPGYSVFGADTHRYLLNPPKTEKELQDFERKCDVVLPSEYRDFFQLVGNGGAGPYYGLYSFEFGTRSLHENVGSGCFPFGSREVKKFIDGYNASMQEGEDENIVYFSLPDRISGVIYLADVGCGWNYFLVVNGDQAGTVWLGGEYLSPCFHASRQMFFWDWYEEWLDESLAQVSLSEKKDVFDERTTILNYDGRKLKEIPREVFQCKNLKKFVFSRNDISTFPKEIFTFNVLHTLDVSMTPIVEIPQEIARLKSLKKFRFNYSNLTTLPDSFAELKNLEELSMHYSYRIAEIPEVVSRMPNLKKLDFSFSGQLKKFPESIGNLRNLTRLVLNNCPLEYLPDGLVELRNLQYLSLGQSKIKRLPGGFERLENLEFLGIDIDVLDLEDALEKIKKMSKLKSLRLVNTRHFPQSLALLEHLQTLVIAQNYTLWRESVVALPVPEEVTLIPHLEILDLENNNQINRLPKAIGNMKYLKELRVGATSIREFPESFRELNSFECVKGNLASDGKSPFGIRREEKEKIQRWFPNAKILIY